MSFRGKDAYEFVQRAREHTIQILLHPIHFSQTDEGYYGILVRYLHGVKDSLEGYFSGVNDSFTDAFPNGLASAFRCVGEQSNESVRVEHASGGARYDSCNRQEC